MVVAVEEPAGASAMPTPHRRDVRQQLLDWDARCSPLLFPRLATPGTFSAPSLLQSRLERGAEDAAAITLREALADGERWASVADLPVGRPALAVVFATLARDRLVHGDAAALRRMLCADADACPAAARPAAIAGLRAWMDAPALSTTRPCALSFAAAANYNVSSSLAPAFIDGAALGCAQPDAPLHVAAPPLSAHLSFAEEAEHQHPAVFLHQPRLQAPHIPGAVGVGNAEEWGDGDAQDERAFPAAPPPPVSPTRTKRQPTQTPLYAAVDTWAQHPPWHPARFPGVSASSSSGGDTHASSVVTVATGSGGAVPSALSTAAAAAAAGAGAGVPVSGDGRGGGIARGCWDDVHVSAPYELQPTVVAKPFLVHNCAVLPPLPPWHHARTIVQALARWVGG